MENFETLAERAHVESEERFDLFISFAKDQLRETKINVLKEHLVKNATEPTVQQLWNEYCHVIGCYDRQIYRMSAFNDLFYGWQPLNLLRHIKHDYFSTDEIYFYDTDDGCYSTNSLYTVVDLDELCGFMVDNEDSLINDEYIDRLLNLFS